MGRFVFFKKKERWTATCLGWLLKFVVFLLFVWIYAKTIVPFLAPVDANDSKIMIVEGFIPDFAVIEAMHIFEKEGYELMIISGKKRLKGAPLDQYPNDGVYSAATLAKLGFDISRVQVVAVENEIMKDRTYQSAVAIKEWLDRNQKNMSSVNLVSIGCHSGRSRLLFQKAFGENTDVGVIAIRNQSYDMDQWWRSSHGFREVTKETIAWIYARFFFYP